MADITVDNIVDYVIQSESKNLSNSVLHHAKRRVVDTIGCALGAYHAPPTRIAREMAIPLTSSFSARVLGSLTRTTPELAAFANGVMVRYLDFNDSSLGGSRGGHPSDYFSGVLAMAEATGANGRDFLLALTICYEVQCRLADSAPFEEKGWDQPIAGLVGVAAACGKLLGLSRSKLCHAISLAVIPNLCSHRTRIGEISMWKACAGANAARQGIVAAVLASKGMTGPTDPFEGRFGVWALTMQQRYDIKPLTCAGEEFAIALSSLKSYPVRTSAQLMVNAALDLRRKIAVKDIVSLRVCTFRDSFKNRDIEWPESWSVTTKETADHSIFFAVAVTFLDGELTPSSYERERYLDTDVHDFIKRAKLELVEAYDAEYAHGIRNCMIEVTTVDGVEYSSHQRATPEEVARGPSDAEIEEKFGRLSEKLMSLDQRRALLTVLWNLENLADVGTVVDHTAILNP